MASSKGLPGEKGQCQLDIVDLHLLEHCTSLQAMSIHSRARGPEFLESLVLHASALPPWKSYNHGRTRKYVPSDEVVISPLNRMVTLPSVAGTPAFSHCPSPHLIQCRKFMLVADETTVKDSSGS